MAEDSATALCEDSCTFADDGQCDEPGVVSDSVVVSDDVLMAVIKGNFAR